MRSSSPQLRSPTGATRVFQAEASHRPWAPHSAGGTLPQGSWGLCGSCGPHIGGPPYGGTYWQYGAEQNGWGSNGLHGVSPPAAPSASGLGASRLAYESELALVHFVVYLVCCIGCVCIYMNYVVLEAHIFALFWAVVFSIPLRAVVSAIAGGPRHRSAPAAGAAAAAAAVQGAPDQQAPQARPHAQLDIRRASTANIASPLLGKQQQQQQQQPQQKQQQQQHSNGGLPTTTDGEKLPQSPSRRSSGLPDDQTAEKRKAVRLKWSRDTAAKAQQQQQRLRQQQQQQECSPKSASPCSDASRGIAVANEAEQAAATAAARPTPAAGDGSMLQRGSSSPVELPWSSSGGLSHRSKKRRQRQHSFDIPGELPVSVEAQDDDTGKKSSSSNSGVTRMCSWLLNCLEGLWGFLKSSLSVRLSVSCLLFTFRPLYELATPLPDRQASKPWFGLLHRCCLLLLLQRLCLSTFTPEELLHALGGLLLLLLLTEVLLLPFKANRFLMAPTCWYRRVVSLRPSLLVSADSMNSYVIPFVSLFVICCFFLCGLLITAFFCFNMYTEITTLWETANSLLHQYILQSASFQEAYTRLSALIQDQQEGLPAAAAAAAAAAGDTAATAAAAPGEAPSTLAGFVAAAASAVRSSASSTNSNSSAPMLLGGSLGWYSDLWRTIQELASASSAAAATAAAAAAQEPPLSSLGWNPTTNRHTEAPAVSLGSPLGGSFSLPLPSSMDITTVVSSEQQQQTRQARVSCASPRSKAVHLLSAFDACPRVDTPLVEDTEGERDFLDFPESCVGPSSDSFVGAGDNSSWWMVSPLFSALRSDPWGPGGEVFKASLHDEGTHSCIDPWGPYSISGGPLHSSIGRVRGAPSLGFMWSSAAALQAQRRKGKGEQGSFMRFFSSWDLWRRWPNTADLLEQLKDGNILAALKRSLQASQEIYSLTSEAWWRYLSEHAHTVLAWAFNSGFGAWRVCCFVLAFLLRFFLSAFDLLFQFVVFVGALYALLCSPKSTLDLLEEVLCVADPSGILSASVNEKIRAILFSSVKKVWFYSLFTWLVFESTEMPVVYVPTAVSCLLALLPLLPPETVSVLPAIALWLHKSPSEGGALSPAGGGPLDGAWGTWLAAPHRIAAVGVCAANALVWWNVTTSIYREIPDASPWLVGLSAALGLSTLGLKGIILGPVLATMPLIVISAASKFNERHIRSQEALGPPEGGTPEGLQQEEQHVGGYQFHRMGNDDKPSEVLLHDLSNKKTTEQRLDLVAHNLYGPPQGSSFGWCEGPSNQLAPHRASWGSSGALHEAGGFALGEWRQGRRSTGGPLGRGFQSRGGLQQEAPLFFSQASPYVTHTPPTGTAFREVPPSAGSGAAVSSNGSCTRTPSMVFRGGGSHGGPHGGPLGTPQQQPLAMHFLKSAADAIFWVLQRRRSNVGGPSGGVRQQHVWSPQQHMMPLSPFRARGSMQSPRKAFSLGTAATTAATHLPACASAPSEIVRPSVRAPVVYPSRAGPGRVELRQGRPRASSVP